jgi:16S rRNA G527 N7-methylase RsmG
VTTEASFDAVDDAAVVDVAAGAGVPRMVLKMRSQLKNASTNTEVRRMRTS